MRGLVDALVPVVIVCAVALCAWFVVERFSPDALLTKIVQVVIFVVVLLVVLTKLLPLAV